jgi:prepilin-type N-terminal cleavage/methylation domain-containing protein
MNTIRLNLRKSSNGFTPQRDTAGFTLPEMLVATAIGSFVIAGVLVLYVGFLRSYRDTTLLRNTSSRASLALERMVHGVGTNAGLIEASASTVAVSYSSGGWRCAYSNAFSASPNPLFFQYAPASGLITNEGGKTICSGVSTSTFACTTSALGVTNGCKISVTVAESSGGHSYNNVMTSFVQFRNQ